jgi:TolB-like protein
LIGVLRRFRERRVVQWGLAYLAVAWLLLQLADTLSDPWNIPGYVERGLAVVLAIGFLLALVLAWYHGEKGRQRMSGPELLILAAIIILSGAVLSVVDLSDDSDSAESKSDAAAASQGFDRSPAPVTAESSIAVLPFANHSLAEENAEFLSDGIHDELITQLGRLDALKVISKTSMLAYRDTDKSLQDIAGELGVVSILEGSVQRAGDTVRIQTKLIDAHSERQIWADSYHYTLTPANLFAVQHEISTAIATALATRVAPKQNSEIARVPTESLAALEAYFKGKQLLEIRTSESLVMARSYFQEAIEHDPSFAHAYAGMAEAWLELPNYSADIEPQTVRHEVQSSVQHAMRLNGELPDVLAVLGWQKLLHEYDWQGAEAVLRKALVIQPNNVHALHWLSHVLSWQGNHEEAIRLAKRGVELDPLSLLIRRNLAYIQMDAAKFNIAIPQFQLIIEQDPYSAGLESLLDAQMRAGDLENAIKTVALWGETRGRDPDSIAQLVQALRTHLKTGEPVIVAPEVMADLAISQSDLAQVYASLGDADGTLTALEQAFDAGVHSRTLLSMRINPSFNFIRETQRFRELLEKIGLG